MAKKSSIERTTGGADGEEILWPARAAENDAQDKTLPIEERFGAR